MAPVGLFIAYANGGQIVQAADGRWWFVPDGLTREAVRLGQSWWQRLLPMPEAFEIKATDCRWTSSFLATFGGFWHPLTGNYCMPTGTAAYNAAWDKGMRVHPDRERYFARIREHRQERR